MSTKKKTASKKVAKKAPTKQAKAFSEALQSFKKPDEPSIVAKRPDAEGFPILTSAPEPAFLEEGDFQEYGPIGDMRAVKLGGETISLEEADKEDGIESDSPSLAEHTTANAPEPSVPHIVPQTAPDAPQTPLHSEPLGQQIEGLGFKMIHTPGVTCEETADLIEELIDGLNFIFKKAKSKVAEKDVLILQARVKRGRELVEQLRA